MNQLKHLPPRSLGILQRVLDVIRMQLIMHLSLIIERVLHILQIVNMSLTSTSQTQFADPLLKLLKMKIMFQVIWFNHWLRGLRVSASLKLAIIILQFRPKQFLKQHFFIRKFQMRKCRYIIFTFMQQNFNSIVYGREITNNRQWYKFLNTITPRDFTGWIMSEFVKYNLVMHDWIYQAQLANLQERRLYSALRNIVSFYITYICICKYIPIYILYFSVTYPLWSFFLKY